MEEKPLLFETYEHTLVVRFNRPDSLNVLTTRLRQAILDLLREHEADPGIRSIVFTGTGKAFSAGADIRYLLTLEGESAVSYSRFVRDFLDYIENYPKVTVGAVNGLAFGGGLEFLLTLDLVVCSEDARFAQSELNVGLIPGGGGTQRLPRLVGLRRAKKMVLTGEAIDARTALDWGLVNMVVPAPELMTKALEIAKKVSEKSFDTLSAAKRLLSSSVRVPLAEGLLSESAEYTKILGSSNAKEGLKAFLEKRKPNYT